MSAAVFNSTITFSNLPCTLLGMKVESGSVSYNKGKEVSCDFNLAYMKAM